MCRLQIQCLRHTAISSLLSHCYLITYTTLPSFHMCACSRYWWRGSVHQGERDSHYYGRIFSNPRWLSRWEREKTEESERRRENWREWEKERKLKRVVEGEKTEESDRRRENWREREKRGDEENGENMIIISYFLTMEISYLLHFTATLYWCHWSQKCFRYLQLISRIHFSFFILSSFFSFFTPLILI